MFIISCSSTPKAPNEKETSVETTPAATDTATVDNTDSGGDSAGSATTDSATETVDTGLIDDANETPLEPTADCIHPEVTADCADGWCRIPKGCFIFGSVDSEGNICRARYAEDQAQVTLTHDFEIGQTETTQAQWKAAGFDLPNPVSKTPCDDCPISWITVHEAMGYANALSAKAGLPECYDLSNCAGTFAAGCPDGADFVWGCIPSDSFDTYVCSGDVQRYDDPYICPGYRLPTTAEWEYAARAGTRTATYIGDMEKDVSSLCISHPAVDTIAWHCGNTQDALNLPQFIPVRQKAPNGFGLYDMLGNVGEFSASTSYNISINDLVGKKGTLTDPAPPLEAYIPWQHIVLRGGYYIDAPCYIRSSRGTPSALTSERSILHGFRPVRTLDIQPAKLKKPAIAASKKLVK